MPFQNIIKFILPCHYWSNVRSIRQSKVCEFNNKRLMNPQGWSEDVRDSRVNRNDHLEGDANVLHFRDAADDRGSANAGGTGHSTGKWELRVRDGRARFYSEVAGRRDADDTQIDKIARHLLGRETQKKRGDVREQLGDPRYLRGARINDKEKWTSSRAHEGSNAPNARSASENSVFLASCIFLEINYSRC